MAVEPRRPCLGALPPSGTRLPEARAEGAIARATGEGRAAGRVRGAALAPPAGAGVPLPSAFGGRSFSSSLVFSWCPQEPGGYFL